MNKELENIRILFVEDLPSDYELAKQTIKREGIGFTCTRVETAEDMLNAISEFKPEIIVSDYSMPQFDGLSALNLALALCPDIPFIILTGSMNEEVAVDCMKAGAADYVIKERIKRLPFAIREALSHSKVKNEKEKAESALIASEARFRRLAENAQDIIYRYEFTPTLRFAYVSPSAKAITGYTPEEHYSNPQLWTKIVHKDDGYLVDWLHYCEEDIRKPIVIRWVRKDSSVAWTEHKNIPIYNSDNTLEAIEGIARDITVAKLVEESLATERLHMKILMDNTPVQIYFKDLDSKFIRGSVELAKHFDLDSPDEVIGKSDFDFFSALHAQKAFDDEQRIISTGIPIIDIEEIETWPDGRESWVLTTKMPLKLPNGKIVGTFGLSRDITERKRIEKEIISKNKELLEAKERAEESDRLKSVFLQNISHEIRTPMNGIVGFVDLLKQGVNNEETAQLYLGLIQKSSNRMLNIISDLVEISRIESGEVTFYSEEFNVNEILTEIIEQFKSEAQDKGIELLLNNIIPDKNFTLVNDRDKLHRSLSHLIKNAITFTHTGKVVIGCASKENSIEFIVQDTGIGIKPEDYNKLFVRFSQVDNSLTRGHEGAGLGLPITKAFVERMGGKIWFNSQYGEGTTFFFSIPCRKVDTESKITPKSKNTLHLNSIKILIVEDDRVSRLLMEEMLIDYNMKVFLVENGQLAVDLIKNNKSFDIILMDIKMPVMDGYAATKAIRELGYSGPILAQTAYSSDSDIQKVRSSGFDAHIAKPINKIALVELINALVSGNMTTNLSSET